MMPRTHSVCVVLAGVLLGALLGCEGGASGGLEARDEIRATLEAYLPRLAQAYSVRDFEGMKGYAAEKEIGAIAKRIEDLTQRGRMLVAEFKDLAIEDINVWSYSNAYVTTVETWDLRVYSTGSEQLLSQELSQRTRVKYQLKRSDEGWLVLFRTIVE